MDRENNMKTTLAENNIGVDGIRWIGAQLWGQLAKMSSGSRGQVVQRP
jgi:hypothetical protein